MFTGRTLAVIAALEFVLGSLLSAAQAPDSPLTAAIEKGDVRSIEDLLQSGVNVNVGDGPNGLPVSTAARKNQWQLVRRLVTAGANPNSPGRELGETLLMSAVTTGDTGLVGFLLDRGADMNRAAHFGTALAVAADLNDEAMVTFLLRRKANPNVAGDVATPLIRAVEHDNVMLARQLLLAGASPNLQRGAITPIHPLSIAAQHGSVEMVTLLLERGANLAGEGTGTNRPDRMTPLHYAGITLNNPSSRSDHLAVIKLLLSKGADPNARNDGGGTPLHSATRSDRSAIVEALLNAGANVNAVDNNGNTALHDAAASGSDTAAWVLIARGANVNAVTKFGTTALHEAARNDNLRHYEIVKALLAAGARTDLRDKNGKTAAELASGVTSGLFPAPSPPSATKVTPAAPTRNPGLTFNEAFAKVLEARRLTFRDLRGKGSNAGDFGSWDSLVYLPGASCFVTQSGDLWSYTCVWRLAGPADVRAEYDRLIRAVSANVTSAWATRECTEHRVDRENRKFQLVEPGGLYAIEIWRDADPDRAIRHEVRLSYGSNDSLSCR
jgi:ankyrin repeat protein